MSNRFFLIEREFVHPIIEGVDFDGRCWVIARSPQAVLLWVYGHSWSVNGHQRYAEPSMILLPDRSHVGNLKYVRITDGGRMCHKLMFDAWNKLKPTFGDDAYPWISNAVNVHGRRTLLVEGGGPKLMPTVIRGHTAEYLAWRDLPAEDKGFLLPRARRATDRHSAGAPRP